jgi:hypothetical protein
MLWQPYPQEGGTHLHKLQAWLDRVVATAPQAGLAKQSRQQAIDALHAMHHAWNVPARPGDAAEPPRKGDRAWLASAWDQYCAALPALAALHSRFATDLASQSDLATRLIEFIDAPARC